MRKLEAMVWLRPLLPVSLSELQGRMRSSFCWLRWAASTLSCREHRESKPGSCTRWKV